MNRAATVIDMTAPTQKPRHYYLSGGLGIASLVGATILLANIIIGVILLIIGLLLTNQFLSFLLRRK